MSSHNLPREIVSTTGRTVFRTDEAIPLRIPAQGAQVNVVFTASGGRRCEMSAPAVAGWAYLTVQAETLTAGKWMVEAEDARAAITLVNSFPLTPFTIGVFAGWFEGEHPQFFNLSGISSEERVRAFSEDYGINLIMLQNRGFPLEPHTVDLLLRAGARFTTLNTHAVMHQPDGEHNDWSHPEVQQSLLYRTVHAAQYLRPYGGFCGVHYADEPGLAWGIETPDGQTFLSGERTAGEGDYQGPLAIATQREMYQRATGSKAPDWRRPFDDFDAWLDYMRWRTSIIGDAFRRCTRELRRVDPNLIGYSQIYEWAVVADGCYPPQEAKGVDVLCTHAYCDRQMGFWYPAHETDAMRSGAQDKPLWMLPTWDMGITPPYGVRACVYSTLARKVEGLLWSHDWAMSWPQAREISERILPVSAMLLQAQKLRDEVGIFYSRDAHLHAYAQHVFNSATAGRDYVGKLNSAWLLAMAAHRPASWLLEEELLAGIGEQHRVLLAPALNYVRPEIRAALERYIAGGGLLLLDASATAEIAGAQHLPFAFADYFNGPGAADYRDWTDRRRFDELIMSYLPVFTAVLHGVVAPLAQCDNPQFMLSRQGADAGAYLWVVNMAQQDRRDEQNRPRCLVAASAELALPAGVAYDVFARQRVQQQSMQLHLEQGDARLYAIMPEEIANVQLENVAWHVPLLSIGVCINGAGAVLDAVIPLQIEICTPGGTRVALLYRASRHGRYAEKISLGSVLVEGEWQVLVTELLSGLTAAATFTVENAPLPPAFVGAVDVVDGKKITHALAAGEALYLLYGDAESRQAAETCDSALRARGMTAVVDEAARYLAERPTTAHTCNPPGGSPLAIEKQVILFGNRASNPLIARLVEKYQLCPRQLDAAYPGIHRALLYWAYGLFGLNHDIIVIYAGDARGLEAGSKELLRLIRS